MKGVDASINEFEFVNNLSFTCLSHYAQSWKIEKDGRVVETGEMNIKVEPLTSSRVKIDYNTDINDDADYYITFEFKTKSEENLLPKGYQVAYDQLALNEKRERRFGSVRLLV